MYVPKPRPGGSNSQGPSPLPGTARLLVRWSIDFKCGRSSKQETSTLQVPWGTRNDTEFDACGFLDAPSSQTSALILCSWILGRSQSSPNAPSGHPQLRASSAHRMPSSWHRTRRSDTTVRPTRVSQIESNMCSQTLHICHICLHWGGLGGRLIGIYGIHGVSGVGIADEHDLVKIDVHIRSH